MSFQEPKLCPSCPLSTKWKNEALHRIKQRQYTRAKTELSALKICMERRIILRELGLECPYFPKHENITMFFGSVKKLNHLQLWHLHRFCDKHGLDYQLIDFSLTYDENKKYLTSLVTDGNIESRLPECESQEQDFMSHHFLTYYVNCINEGATKSEETGKSILGGIRTRTRFSLAEWILQNSRFLGC